VHTVVKTWEVPDIGPVAVAVSDRARYARITISRDGAVKLILPRRVSLKQGRRYLESGRAWIRRHLQQVRAAQADPARGRVQARKLLVERLNALARVHGFTYRKVFVKNQRTLWGSCSSANNINLNVNLTRLPDELRDYVILHELVHTRHKNHSRAFWEALNRIVGDGKKLQRQLRQYQPGAAV
jgi:predicted metal-dependent hydrolase